MTSRRYTASELYAGRWHAERHTLGQLRAIHREALVGGARDFDRLLTVLRCAIELKREAQA